MSTRFQFKRKYKGFHGGNRLQLIDTDEGNTPMTVVQIERLGRDLIAEAKRMKRVHRLRRLVPIRLLE